MVKEKEEDTAPKETSTPSHMIIKLKYTLFCKKKKKDMTELKKYWLLVSSSLLLQVQLGRRWPAVLLWTTCDHLFLDNSFVRVTRSNDHFFSSHYQSSPCEALLFFRPPYTKHSSTSLTLETIKESSDLTRAIVQTCPSLDPAFSIISLPFCCFLTVLVSIIWFPTRSI